MKLLKILTVLILVLLVNFCNSQDYQKKPTDTIALRIPYKYILAANKSYIEVKGLRLAFANSQRETYIANARIKFLELALANSQKSDSICSKEKYILQKKFDFADTELLKVSQQYKQEKREKVALAVTTPLGIIAGFIIGFFLHK